MHEQLLRQEAARETRALIERLTAATAQQRVSRPLVCLVRPNTPLDGAPEHARLTRMNARVADALAGFGLHAPVSLTHVGGFWWVAHVDAAHLHCDLEFGGAYCTRVVCTLELSSRLVDGYTEVIDGPFASEAEARAALSAQ